MKKFRIKSEVLQLKQFSGENEEKEERK